MLTRGTVSRRIPFWLRVERPLLEQEPHRVLTATGTYTATTRGGKSLVPLRDPDESWLRPALAALVAFVQAGGAQRLAVERFDSKPIVEADVLPLLVEAGFLAGPRRAVLRP